jgi:tetratricopeptide (TPR) repeat protein
MEAEFLNVQTLLELSQPRSRVPWFWYGIFAITLLAMVGALGSSQPAEVRETIDLFSLVIILTLMITTAMTTVNAARRHRTAQQAVESVEELIQLRRWQQAGLVLQGFLSQPAPSQRLRAQALVYLASVLSRHQRFEDAIAVQNYLLENELVDESSDYGLRLLRAMSILREENLVDADRAISDLRRRGSAGSSGGLALIEIYRDVKTGHPAEAIEIFEERLPVMQRQLGHRVADAHGLVARAYDMLGRESEAAAAYERATLLAPAAELQRRYPELIKLTEKYQPAPAPAEAA